MLSKRLVALFFLLALASPLALLAKQEGTGVGDLVLDFTLEDIDGKTHVIKDCRGRTVMLYFWATW